MKILYRQTEASSILNTAGISNCCFKHLIYDRDKNITSKKEHHHTGYEIHIIKNGHQIYKIGKKNIMLGAKSFLVLPPELRHSVAESAAETEKYSLTFNTDSDSIFCLIDNYMTGTADTLANDNIRRIMEECRSRASMYREIAEMRIYEILIDMLRKYGFVQNEALTQDTYEDAGLAMAKQYIKDNTESNLKVSDVASYCYLSCKQLTRLFEKEDTTPGKYIRDRRILHIEFLLAKSSLSLRAISEKMNFSSEYHFNSFFKKYAGMTPGEYRKMFR